MQLLAREVTVGLLLATPLLLLGLAGVQGLAWSIVATVSLGLVMLRALREIRTLLRRV
jgi:hypothetical protein